MGGRKKQRAGIIRKKRITWIIQFARIIQVIRITWIVCVVSLLPAVSAAASVEVREVCAWTGESPVWNIRLHTDDVRYTSWQDRREAPDEMSIRAWILDPLSDAETPCTVRTGQAGEESLLRIRTAILLDNSLSIREENREKVRVFLEALFQAHRSGEEFRLYTFSTQTQLRGSGTDYAALAQTVKEITYENQDSYLIDCIAQVLEELGQSREESRSYDRLIVISDGTDDNRAGRTYADLLEMLAADAYRCPVYTLTSVWEGNDAGLKNLAALSGKTGAGSYALEETTDPSKIAAQIESDEECMLVSLEIPPEERDGKEKAIRLTVSTPAGEYETARDVFIPGWAGTGTRITAESDAFPAADETKPSEEETLLTERETGGRVPADKADGSGKAGPAAHFLLWAGAGAGMFLALAGVFAVSLVRKHRMRRQRSVLPGNMGPSGGREATEEYETSAPGGWQANAQRDRELTLAGEDRERIYPAPADHTVGMWEMCESCSGIRVILTHIGDRRNRHEVRLREEASIGRDSLCSIVVQGDPTVSGVHCRLIRQGLDVAVEDLHSKNGTAVNGKRICGIVRLHSEDVLALGATRMRVEIIRETGKRRDSR